MPTPQEHINRIEAAIANGDSPEQVNKLINEIVFGIDDINEVVALGEYALQLMQQKMLATIEPYIKGKMHCPDCGNTDYKKFVYAVPSDLSFVGAVCECGNEMIGVPVRVKADQHLPVQAPAQA